MGGTNTKLNQQVNLAVLPEEGMTGCQKTLQYSAARLCPACNGTGDAKGRETKVCPTCGGETRTVTQTPFGTIARSHCKKCKGLGRIVKKACPACSGTGGFAQLVQLAVTVPPGTRGGNILYFEGQGGQQPLPQGGIAAGNLYVNVLYQAPQAQPGSPPWYSALPLLPSALSGVTVGDFSNIFESFFGSGFGGGSSSSDSLLTQQEFKQGSTRQMSRNYYEKCHQCEATGTGPDGNLYLCPTCAGTGVYNKQPCFSCNGFGKVVHSPCPHCHGHGRTMQNKTVTVTLAPGQREAHMPGAGDYDPFTGQYDDLNFYFNVRT